MYGADKTMYRNLKTIYCMRLLAFINLLEIKGYKLKHLRRRKYKTKVLFNWHRSPTIFKK